jgi:amidase
MDNSKLQIHNSNGAELSFLEATVLARLIRARELSAEEVLAACLEQIERTNPRVNAIVTLVPERAMRDARRRRAPR